MTPKEWLKKYWTLIFAIGFAIPVLLDYTDLRIVITILCILNFLILNIKQLEEKK